MRAIPSETRKPKSPSKRERVLDVAEEQFAIHGFDGVTVRQIAARAHVDVALPNYYFGSKRGLFDAVFLRRAKLFNQARSEALDAVLERSGGRPPRIEDVVEAFLRPIAEAQLSSDPGWRNYCRLVALVNNSPVWVGMMTSYYDALIDKFIATLRLALPNLGDRDLYWAYHFLSGSLTVTMANTGRINHLSGGICKSDDFEDAYAHMVKFFSDGLKQTAKTKRALGHQGHLPKRASRARKEIACR